MICYLSSFSGSGALAGLRTCACGNSGLSFDLSFGASGRADTRVGSFRTLLWTFGAFLGPFGTLSLALAPSPLFLLFGRLQEQAPRPALSGRLALQAPRQQRPKAEAKDYGGVPEGQGRVPKGPVCVSARPEALREGKRRYVRNSHTHKHASRRECRKPPKLER